MYIGRWVCVALVGGAVSRGALGALVALWRHVCGVLVLVGGVPPLGGGGWVGLWFGVWLGSVAGGEGRLGELRVSLLGVSVHPFNGIVDVDLKVRLDEAESFQTGRSV